MNAIDSSTINTQTRRGRVFSAIKKGLAHPWLPLFLVVIAVLLSLPSLRSGLQLDDYLHRMIMLDLSPVPIPLKIFSAYNFVDVNPGRLREGIELGIFPWWTVADFRISFFRPLGSLLLWLDYQLWPDLPVLMHLHSIAWYAAIAVLAFLFYRRIMGATWIAGLAALLFAVDYRHATPAGMLSNRYALMCLFFGLLCLLAYDGWRRSGKKWLALASPACLALALLSGEAAVAVPLFLFAYAIALDRGTIKERVLALLPNAAVGLAYAVMYQIFRYGSHGSGMYLNPLEEPAAFMKAFITNVPALLLSQWAPIPAQIGQMISSHAFIVLVAVFFLMLVFLLYSLVRQDRVARFFTMGMLLSLVPIAGIEPQERSLIFVGLGAMGLLAQVLGGLVRKSELLPSSRAWRRIALPLGIMLALAHLVINPISFPNNPGYITMMNDFYINPVKSIPDDRELSRQCLILVNPPDYIYSVGFIPFFRILDGKSSPKSIRSLFGGPGPAEITRVDDRTLQVKTPRGLFNYVLGKIYVSPEKPLVPGQLFNLGNMTVRIHGVAGEQGPTEVTYRFKVPLEDPSLRWLQLENGKYVPFTPPAIGKSVMVRGLDLMDVFFPKEGSK